MKVIKSCVFVFAFVSLIDCDVPLSLASWSESQEVSVSSVVDLVSTSQLQSVMTEMDLIRHVSISTDVELADIAETLASRLSSHGLTTTRVPVTANYVSYWDPVGEVSYDVPGPHTMDNIVAVRPGTNPDLAPILVTAHWDTIPISVGMNDNASGCAGVIETARVLQSATLERTVIFVLFAFEEDEFVGSAAYVESMDATPKAVINLEQIGFTSPVQNALPFTDVLLEFPTVGDFIGIVASNEAKNLGLAFASIADAFVPELPTYYIGADATLQNNPLLTDFFRSDHISFWEREIPALMITDTSFLREGNFYHQPEDTIDNIDFTFMTNVVRATVALVSIEAGIQ